MLCKHEVVGSIPSGSTRASDRAAFGWLAGPDFGLSNIKFRPGASSLARVIHHRKEEMHPVGFGRRRSVALARKGSRVGSSSSVFSQWASLTASLPGVFEANWSLSISPESCRLSGWAYASKKIEPNGSLRMKGGRRAERWASIMRAIKCLKSIRWMPWR